MKNNLAPINRIPPHVFSTIPVYWADEDAAEEHLITATHVCRSWRNLFISRPSLWAHLDCKNIEKTRVYVERSKSSPLNVYIRGGRNTPFPSDAFLLMIPHLSRLRSLSLFGSSGNLTNIINQHLHCPAPSLEELKIRFTGAQCPIEATIFDGNLSSLRELRLSGVLTSLPWGNLQNLTTFYLRNNPKKVHVTQLLDFFECAPLLSNITLWNASSSKSDAPHGRVVSLPHLKFLQISSEPANGALLKHLLIPIGVVLILDFHFQRGGPPIPICLPKPFDNLKNIFPIISINLLCNSSLSLRLNGPNGGVYIYGKLTGGSASLLNFHHQGFRSLDHLPISSTERLTIGTYNILPPPQIERSIAYQTLLLMKSLRTLTLTDCHNATFIFALDPSKNSSRTLLCPALEELILYIKREEQFCLEELLVMTKERSSKDAGLLTIKIISTEIFASAAEVFKLRDHVMWVKYRLDDVVPAWDDDPDGKPVFKNNDDW